jgi:hypothetical protein
MYPGFFHELSFIKNSMTDCHYTCMDMQTEDICALIFLLVSLCCSLVITKFFFSCTMPFQDLSIARCRFSFCEAIWANIFSCLKFCDNLFTLLKLLGCSVLMFTDG